MAPQENKDQFLQLLYLDISQKSKGNGIFCLWPSQHASFPGFHQLVEKKHKDGFLFFYAKVERSHKKLIFLEVWGAILSEPSVTW